MKPSAPLVLLLGLALGFAGGWIVHGVTRQPRPERSARRNEPPAAATTPRADEGEPGDALPARRPPRAAPERADGDAEATNAAAEGAGEDAAAAGDETSPFADMIKSQKAQWKAFAGMQAKQKLKGLFAALGLDDATTAAIEEAVMRDVERQVDRAVLMMLGDEEIDPSAFASFMGIPADLSPALEHELGTFLDDVTVGAVRQQVKTAYRKQLDDMADMQIRMMAVPNLRDDQQTRLREVFGGKDVMSEQISRFATVMRDREKLDRLVSGEGDLSELMKDNFADTRRRVRDILDDEQFQSYERYEKQMIQQAEMGLKMMGAMLKKKAPSGTGTQNGQ